MKKRIADAMGFNINHPLRTSPLTALKRSGGGFVQLSFFSTT